MLKSEPRGDVQITILDGNGQSIRQFKGTKQAGINRLYWDLRYEPTKEVELRTTPESHPHVGRKSGSRERTLARFIITELRSQSRGLSRLPAPIL